MAVNEQQPSSEQLAAEIAGRFPPESLLTVRVAHERSDPESTEPRPPALDVRLIPRGPDEYNAFATETPGTGRIPEAVYNAVVRDFQQTYEAPLRQLGKDLTARIPDLAERIRLGVAYGGYQRTRDLEPPLTPVMARLARPDLETLDVLIAAGCAPNRADAIRWALARVRERPAYATLVERVREVQALRAAL
jgi:hypothetical protein